MCWWEFTGGVVNQKISRFQGGRMLRIDPVTEVLGRTQDRKWLLCFVAVKKPLESWSVGRQSKRPTIWTENTRGLSGMILLVKGWGVFLTCCYPSFPVDAGHRAVIFDRFRGVQDIVVGEGTHFLIPWVQKPIIFDCRSRPRNVPVITGSKGESHLWVR